MMDLADILQKRQCFKLVCGAGNEDCEQVKRLVYVYALAGATLFDLSAKEDVVLAAQEALEKAKSDALLSVSVGISGDPHIRKAYINKDECVGCGACAKVCPQNAIEISDLNLSGLFSLEDFPKVNYSDDKVLEKHSYKKKRVTINPIKCIGCGKCEDQCVKNAISFESHRPPLEEILAPLNKYNIAVYELHAIGDDDKQALSDWNVVCQQNSRFKSLCIDRSALGNKRLIQRIKDCIANRGDFTTIIQTDGTPMSGGKDDFRTTLQAIATAELVTKYNLPVYILLSGGTNSNSSKLASIVNVPINGVAIGSFARQIVKPFIESDDFWNQEDLINMAITRAKILVRNILDGVNL